MITAKETKNIRERSIGLDLTRALAITLVITSHFSRDSRNFGFWGVEIFFSLSGFLIGQILWRNYLNSSKWTVKQVFNFWSRRWWRTIPNYYLFLIINLILNVIVIKPIPSFFNFVKFLYFGQFFTQRSWHFFEVSWSLCVEEWLYILFPLLILIYSKLSQNKKIVFLSTFVTILLISASFRYHLHSTNSGVDMRLITLARLDSIGFGILIAFLYKTFTFSNAVRLICFCFGLILILTPIFATFLFQLELDSLINNQIILTIVPFGASLTLPYMYNVKMLSNFSFLRKIITKVSLWSYSLYLCHMPILYLVYVSIGKSYKIFVINLCAKLVGFALSFLLSWFLYSNIEVPFTKRRPAEI